MQEQLVQAARDWARDVVTLVTMAAVSLSAYIAYRNYRREVTSMDPHVTAEITSTPKRDVIAVSLMVYNKDLSDLTITEARVRRPRFARIACAREGPFGRRITVGKVVSGRRGEHHYLWVRVPAWFWRFSVGDRVRLSITLTMALSRSQAEERRIKIKQRISRPASSPPT